MKRHLRHWLLTSTVVLAGRSAVQRPPIPTVPHVDLPRFMGDWYVIANIPTFVETDAYNAVESYRLDTDGTIATTSTFRQGSYAGALNPIIRAASSWIRSRMRSGACSSSGRWWEPATGLRPE